MRSSYAPDWRKLLLQAFLSCGLLSFSEKNLPIGEFGIAETGNYGPADKHMQTQKQIVVSIDIFNKALNFQYGWEKKVWLNHAMIMILTGHEPSLCQKRVNI